MNKRAIFAVVRKDLRVVTQSKGVMLPLIIVPIVMLVLLPALVAFIPLLDAQFGATEMQDMQAFLANMPPSLQTAIAGFNLNQQLIYLLLVYLFAPMYLIVPMMVASVIAADSFAGEKERKTLEALLYTPTTDFELVAAKLVAAWVPAIIVAWVGFILYGIVANGAAWGTMGQIFFPNTMWVVLALWVAPGVAGLGLSATVLVSVRANSFQDAYQMGAMVVLPLVILMISQAVGVLYLSVGFVFLLGLVCWIIDAVLLWLSVKLFQRSEIIARL